MIKVPKVQPHAMANYIISSQILELLGEGGGKDLNNYTKTR